jgi:hypothetical protein
VDEKITLVISIIGLPTCVYFYTIQAVPIGREAGSPSTGSGQSFVGTKKMILMK